MSNPRKVVESSPVVLIGQYVSGLHGVTPIILISEALSSLQGERSKPNKYITRNIGIFNILSIWYLVTKIVFLLLVEIYSLSYKT